MFDSFVSHKHTKLVDADAMKESIKGSDTDEYRIISTKELHEALNEWIDGRPPVDAVPVVRCKNCKHRDPEDRKCDCGHDIMWQLPRGDDWYCADGKPKDKEEE
jgi:hypothetical protein